MDLYVDPSIPRFTRAELVADLQERFDHFQDGTLRRWQEVGLAAAPRRERRWSKGQPGSAPGLYSDHDRKMLIAVLELRDRFADEVGGQFEFAAVARFVVWSWVYWDDVVRLDQARRALRTCVEPQLGGPRGRARSRPRFGEYAEGAIACIAAPDAEDAVRARVAARLADVLWTATYEELPSLESDFAAVMDPDGRGRLVGAPGASVDAAGELDRLRLIHAGADAVLDETTVTPADWVAVRNMMRVGWAEYRREWPSIVASAYTPEVFEAPTVQYQVDRCPTTLVMLLGARLDQGRHQAP